MVDRAPSRARAVAAWIAAALFGLLVAACTRDLPVPELLKQAKELHAKGDLQGAAIQLKNALLKEPKNAEVRFVLGLVYNDAGDARSAEKELREAKKLGLIEAGHVDAALGRAMVADNQFKAVLEEIRPSPAFDAAATALVYSARGDAYLALGNVPEARQAFKDARAAKADAPEAMLGQARIVLLEGKRADGLAILEEILAAHPRQFATWMLKGDLLRTGEKVDEAIAAYGSALKIRPSNLVARISRASAYVSAGKYAEAQADVDAAKKVAGRHPLVNYTQAFIHFRQSKFREAQESVQQALQVAPTHGPSLLLSGAISHSLGSFAQAETQLSRFVRAFPSNQMGRKILAATLIELNKGEQALEVIGPLAAKDTQDWVVYALAGGASLRSGDFDSATEMFERAVKSEAKNPQLRSNLGMSYLGRGDVDRALGELEEATALSATLGQANTVLVVTYMRNKQYDKALEAIGRFEAKDPKAPILHHLRGAVLRAKGDPAAARASFQKALDLQPTFFPAAASLAAGYIEEKNLAAARKVYGDVLAKDKTNLPTLLALARVHALELDHGTAAALLERARQAHPGAPAPRIELAAYFLKSGEPQKASVVALEAQRLAPDNPAVLDVVGSAQLATGEAASAVVSFTSLARIQPNSVAAQSGLGFANMRLKKYAEAAEHFSKGLKLRPGDGALTIALIESLRSAKKYDDAVRIAREFRKAQPTLSAGPMLEGDVRFEQRQYAEALKLYEAAFEIDKSGPLVTRAYMAQTRAGDPKGALARLESWVRENPTDAGSRSTLAEAMLSAGNYKAAVDHYQTLVKRTEQDPLSLNNLAFALHKLGDPRALEYAERALKLVPKNPLVLDTYGWILVSLNRAKEAVPHLDNAAVLLPNVPEVRYHLGAALAKAGDTGRAKRELERALAGGKPFPGINEAKSILSKL